MADAMIAHAGDAHMKRDDCILFSGGAPGAEAAFGACAERHGIEEVNFTFDGHKIVRHRGVRVLNHEELQAGDVSLEYVSRLMHRRFTDAPTIRKVLQTLWYQVNNGQEIYVVGTILEDGTVRGGTGWGAEFAKLCNKPLHVFDQDKDRWFTWTGEDWEQRSSRERPGRSRIRTSPAPARGRCRTTASARSRSCSPARSAPLLDLLPAVEPPLDFLFEPALRRLVVLPSLRAPAAGTTCRRPRPASSCA